MTNERSEIAPNIPIKKNIEIYALIRLYWSMRSFSVRKLIVLNALIIVFAMSPVLAHSACFMGSGPAEPPSSADTHIEMDMADMIMADNQAPCHGQEVDDNGQLGQDSKTQCCTACSLAVILASRAKNTSTRQQQVIPIQSVSMVIRSIEIAFRPPIKYLL